MVPLSRFVRGVVILRAEGGFFWCRGLAIELKFRFQVVACFLRVVAGNKTADAECLHEEQQENIDTTRSDLCCLELRGA